jgi:DNA-binding MarR family transcriptional regulator
MRLSTREALDLWRRTVVETVRRDEPDLTARQLAVLLSVYLGDPPHTVRRLAHDLNVAKPAVTRALDRLCALDLVRRKTDPRDARSILVQRTVRGSVFLSEFADVILRAAAQAGR